MTEKIKVSREVAEIIEDLRCYLPSLGYGTAIKQFERKDNVDTRFVKTRAFFNEDVTLFIRAFLGDYEIEETPEEKWAKKYKDYRTAFENRSLRSDFRYESQASAKTIEEMANDFGLKIEGVNA